MLTHPEIWSALDALAQRFSTTPSGLARMAELDPTTFNRSKRLSSDTPPRPRWPSTESLSKVLAATGVGFAEFAELASGPSRRTVPLIGWAQAGADGWHDDPGFPTGQGWDEVEVPGPLDGGFAIEIAGDSMVPLYRPGDRVIARAMEEDPRRGDRVIVRTTAGEVMAKAVVRITAKTLTLGSINPAYPDRVLPRADVAAIARILWAAQ